MTISKERDSAPDLLRIISMLLIVFLHSIDHSGVLEQASANGGGYMSMCSSHMHCARCASTVLSCLAAIFW